MRSNLSPRSVLGAARLTLLGLAFVAAGIPAARGAEPLPPAVVMGTVVDAVNRRPVPYANVTDTTLRAEGTRLGAVTDRDGRFRFAVPAGKVAIRVMAVGSPALFDHFEVAPGETVRREYRLRPTGWSYEAARESLSARGAWPPTLDPQLRAHMRDALDVRVHRLDPTRAATGPTGDPAGRIGPWPIAGEAPRLDRAVVHRLVETLRRSELYLPNLRGVRKLCPFAPEIAVRFNNTGISTDLLLCYDCGEFEIWSAGKWRQSGDFETQAPAFVRFAKTAFPDDPEIKKFGKKDARAAR